MLWNGLTSRNNPKSRNTIAIQERILFSTIETLYPKTIAFTRFEFYFYIECVHTREAAHQRSRSCSERQKRKQRRETAPRLERRSFRSGRFVDRIDWSIYRSIDRLHHARTRARMHGKRGTTKETLSPQFHSSFLFPSFNNVANLISVSLCNDTSYLHCIVEQKF